MAAPNDKELIVLEKFRMAVANLDLNEDQQGDDMFLLRWLRAREMDISKAHEMLRKSLAWQKEHDLCNILNWAPPPWFHEELRYNFWGQTPGGCPILDFPFGKWDFRKAVESGHREEFLKYFDLLFAQAMFRMKETSEGRELPVTQLVVIANFDHFSMRQFSSFSNLSTVLDVVRRYESNYPEILRAAYVINASRIFTLFFRMMKPLLSTRTLSKVHVFGTNRSQWEKVLLENIPADQFPARFGGTFPEPHSAAADSAAFTSTVVGPGQRLSIDLDVHHVKTVLSWEFWTDEFDIGFSINYNGTEIRRIAKLDSHVNVQKGSICCENIGTYIIIFDNSHSRFRGKTVHYRTETVVP